MEGFTYEKAKEKGWYSVGIQGLIVQFTYEKAKEKGLIIDCFY